MIELNGNFGEGGGQILRTSLSLAAVTGQQLHLTGIRARREQPGLKRQHLTCVRAIAEITDAELEGDKVGSMELTLKPRRIKGGSYYFAVGTAGCVSLIAQAILPALLFADAPSEAVIEGGTHVDGGPMTDFLLDVYLPCLRQMGIQVEAEVAQAGFYPAGGGRLALRVQPHPQWRPFVLKERGALKAARLVALDCRLPQGVAADELALFPRMASACCEEVLAVLQPEIRKVSALSSGNALWAEVQYENVTELFSACGTLGLPRRTVARRAAGLLNQYCRTSAPVGCFLADQLLLPMCLGCGGEFSTIPLSLHSTTNIKVIQKFLDCKINALEINHDSAYIQIER